MRFDIWRALAIIITLALIGAGWYFYGLNKAANITIRNLTDRLRTAQKEAESQRQVLEREVTDIKKERDALLDKINDYEAKIQEMAANHEAKIQEMAADMNKLNARLAQKEKELPEKEAEINFLKEALKKDRDKIDRLNKKSANYNSKDTAASPVSLQPITVTAEPKKINGKVLEVNNEYGFLVTNIGAKDGVKAGDTLFVQRRKAMLGKALVEKVSDSASVAKMLYKALADTVRKGDLVSN